VVGVFIMIGLVLLGVLSLYIKQTPVQGAPMTLRARYDSIATLRVGDRVTLAGVEIGQVQSFKVLEDAVEVEMGVGDQSKVKKDSLAQLRSNALIGAYYIELTLGSPTAPLAQNGDLLESVPAASIDQVVQTVNSAASEIKQLAGSFNENQSATFGRINRILDENEENISRTFANLGESSGKIGSTLDNLSQITGDITAGKGTLGKLFTDESLYNKLQSVSDNLESASAEFGETFKRINASEGSLAKLIDDPALYDEAKNAFTQLGTAAERFSDFTGSFSGGQGTLGKLVSDPELYDEALKAVRTINSAAENFSETMPIVGFSSVVFGALSN